MKQLLMTGIRRFTSSSIKLPIHALERNGNRAEYRQFRISQSNVFGRAVEIDVLPIKTCSFDCIYCQNGRTVNKTIEHIQYSPGLLLHELDHLSQETPVPDHIVITGKGDPAICRGIAAIIQELKRITSVPVAVVSCGGLLWKGSVQRDLAQADIVVASLDASDKTLYQCINRPMGLVPFSRFFDGLMVFRKNFKGEFWLQVTLLNGINAIEADVKRIAGLAGTLKPAKIFLRTVGNSPVEDFALPVEVLRLHYFAGFFSNAKVVVVEQNALNQTPPSDECYLPLGMHD